MPGFTPIAPAAAPSGGSLTQSVQIQLIRLGYMQGPADGVLGPQTSTAISNYQRASGMTVNGAPTPALLTRLQTTQ
ncbi:MAG: peptidoglycan-binding domain-containing protein [Acetobacteraceae bacterium]